MQGFWLSLMMTFWAEMGDKTQLVALAYAARYRLRDVLVGVAVATALVHLLSVALGRLIAHWLPIGYVQALSALCFAAFGLWTLRGDEADDPLRESKQHPAVFIGITFFLAEFGDKTMLTAVTLATEWSWMAVWLGTTLGMIASDGLAIVAGRLLGQRLPEKKIRWVGALLFFGFAGWSAWQAFQSFRLAV